MMKKALAVSVNKVQVGVAVRKKTTTQQTTQQQQERRNNTNNIASMLGYHSLPALKDLSWRGQPANQPRSMIRVCLLS